MSTCFVLSGGGAAGSAQFGIIKALIGGGIRPQKLFGTSAGALNAFGLSYAGIEGLETLWTGIKDISDVFSLHWLPIYSGLHSAAPLRKLLLNCKIGVPEIPFSVFATSLKTGLLVEANQDNPNILEYTLGSASIPVIVDNVNVDGHILADGGIIDNWPLRQAVQEGFDDIYILNCLSGQERSAPPITTHIPIIDSALGALNASVTQIMTADLIYKDINPNVTVNIITPSQSVVDVFDFNAIKIKAGIAQGYADGMAFLKRFPRNPR